MDLTKTEFKVCAYTASGYEPKETARILHKSYHTIASHIKSIRLKNGLKNVAELTMHFVLENGDPRKLIAVFLLSIHIGMIYNDVRARKKRVKRNYASKQKNLKRSKTREYYI